MNSNMFRTRCRTLRPAVLAILATFFVFATATVAAAVEPSPGSITGSVVLPDGTGVAGATVTVRGQEAGSSRTAVTGPKGEFTLEGVPAGRYQASVQAAGGKILENSPLVVTAGQATRTTLTMDRPESSASVLVTAQKADLPSALALEVDDSAVAALRPSTSDTASLLRDVPGVSLYGAGGISSLPAIHGLADDRVRVKVDGMDIVAACPNHMNSPLSYIDPTNVAGLKVFSGVTPVSVGGDSIGGSIQVSSAAPEFAKGGQGTLLKGGAGGFYRSNGNAWGGNLSALVAGESLSFSYNGSYAQSGNYKAAREFKPSGYAAMGQAWLDGDVVGSSKFKAWNHEIGLALRLENHLVELKLGLQDVPYEGFPNQRMDMTGNDSKHVNLRYTGQYSWGLFEARAWGERTNHSMNFGDDKQYWYSGTIPGMPMDTKGENSGAMVRADVAISGSDTLRAGAEYQRFRLDDWWSPSGGMMAPDTFWNINGGKRDRLGVFGEWEARWTPQWTTQLGVRSDTVKMDTGPVQGYYNTNMMAQYLAESTAFNTADRNRTDNNWDVTALVRFTPGATQSYVLGWARKTRSPNLYERYTWSTGGMAMVMNNLVGDGNGYVGNLDLKPEVANTVSLTASWHDATKEKWELAVTPYYTSVKDFVDAKRCVSANMNCGAMNQTATTGFVYLQYVNLDARLYGVDVSGHVRLTEGGSVGLLDATGVLGYVRGESRTTGGDLYNIMPLNAKLALVQRVGGFTNTVEAQFVAAKTNLSQVRNEVGTAGYGLFALRSSYAWKMLRVDLGVENLFNTFFQPPLGGAYVGQGMTMSGTGVPWGVPVPGPGRSIYAALNVKL